MSTLFSILELVNFIFSKPPEKAWTYPLIIPENFHPDKRVCEFPYLMSILVNGAKKLFGDDITPQTMTLKQFETLKKYMLSMGYKVHHKYTNSEDGEPFLIHIWFEESPKPTIKCNGMIIY
jgi:hypothetical protein